MPAALAASGIAGLLYAFYDAGIHGAGDVGLADFLLVLVHALLAALGGFVIAWPGLLLIGLPLTWPLRRQIAAHPLIAALIYGPVGAGAGRLIMIWLDRGSAFPGRENVPATIFGAVTALAWVWTLRKARGLMENGA